MRLEGWGWARSCWLVSVSVLSKYRCPTSTWWSFSSWSSLAGCFFKDVFFRWSNTEAVCCGECFKFWLRRVFLDQSVHWGRLSSIWEVKPLWGKCSIFSPDGFPELNVVNNTFPCFYSLFYWLTLKCPPVVWEDQSIFPHWSSVFAADVSRDILLRPSLSLLLPTSAESPLGNLNESGN